MSSQNLRRIAYCERFNLRRGQYQWLTEANLDQLDRCKSDAARRIILGVSVYTPSRKEKGIIRKRIYGRSGGFCEECHRYILEESGEWGSMHLSHTRSKGAGGSWDDENLKALCMTCHLVGVHMGGKVVPKKETVH